MQNRKNEISKKLLDEEILDALKYYDYPEVLATLLDERGFFDELFVGVDYDHNGIVIEDVHKEMKKQLEPHVTKEIDFDAILGRYLRRNGEENIEWDYKTIDDTCLL